MTFTMGTGPNAHSVKLTISELKKIQDHYFSLIDRYGIAAPYPPSARYSPDFFTDGRTGYIISPHPQWFAPTIRLKPSEVRIHVDLTFPIDALIDEIKIHLKSLQKEMEEKGELEVTTKRSLRELVDRYRIYLRVLDAEAVNISNNEIARILIPRVSNKHPDYNARDRIKGYLNAARKMRDNDYRYLCVPKRKKVPKMEE